MKIHKTTFCHSIFLLSLIFLNLITIAQQPIQEWVARYTGPSNDLYGPFLQVDKEGNSYIAGTHVVNDSINILCVKYNTNGIQQWAALYKFPGHGYFAPTGLALDTFGNAYVTSIYGQTPSNPNSLLVKFNGVNGSFIWANSHNGQYGTSQPLDIKIDNLNNIYVAGWSDTSHLVIKYNINGDSLWIRKSHVLPARDLAFACAIDDSSNVILTGVRRYCLTFPPPGGCFDTLLAAKYSPNGDLRWIRTFRYNNSGCSGRKITTDQNGSIYIGGQTGISGFGVYLALKYNLNGIQQWASIYDAPGTGNNGFEAIAVDRINNFLYVTGGAVTNGTQMATTIKYNISTGDSLWVRKDTGTYSRANSSAIRVDSNGNIYTTGGTYNLGLSPFDIISRKYTDQSSPLWLITYNGPFNGIDFGIDLELDNFRNIYVLATSESGPGIRDYIIIKYSQLSGIQTTGNEIPGQFKLNQNYPNPFNPVTTIRFSIPKSSFVQLRVFDVLGKLIELPVNESVRAAEYEMKINGAGYSSGVYFYQLIADGSIIDTKKFVVLK
jgi:hypothetical protein